MPKDALDARPGRGLVSAAGTRIVATISPSFGGSMDCKVRRRTRTASARRAPIGGPDEELAIRRTSQKVAAVATALAAPLLLAPLPIASAEPGIVDLSSAPLLLLHVSSPEDALRDVRECNPQMQFAPEYAYTFLISIWRCTVACAFRYRARQNE